MNERVKRAFLWRGENSHSVAVVMRKEESVFHEVDGVVFKDVHGPGGMKYR